MHNDRSPGALFGLFLLALIYSVYWASAVLIPLVVAVLVALLLYPVVNALQKLHIPRAVSAVALLIAIGVPFTFLGMELADPVRRWIDRAPELTEKVNEQLETISDALVPPPEPADTPAISVPPPEPVKEPEPEPSLFKRFANWIGGETPGETPPEPAPVPVIIEQPPAADPPKNEISRQIGVRGLQLTLDLVAEMPVFIAQCLSVILLVLFLLVYGPGVYGTAVAVLPFIEDKALARTLATDIQRELSRYIFTVGSINIGVGLVTTAALWHLGLEDPLLWGSMVALLNFAPYVGPFLGMAVIAFAGLDQGGMAWASLLPAGVYFLINLVESQLVTPIALGRSIRMNPLFTIVWLMLWGWLWGAAGVLIAMPLAVCIRLVLGRLRMFDPWLQIIETR